MHVGIANRRRIKRAGAVVGTVLFLEISGLWIIPRVEAVETKTSKQAQQEREQAIENEVLGEGKKGALQETSPQQIEGEAAEKEIQQIEKELLNFPKKRRIHFGQDADVTYDNNVARKIPHHEEGDSTFNLNPSALLDLSGRKTDLRLEYRWKGSYQYKRSELPGSDTFNQELSTRLGRKILPKTLLSVSQRLGRSASRVADMDEKKVSFDQTYRSSVNYEFSKKIALNLDGSFSRTDFPHEKFEKDKTRQWTMSPGTSFLITPKTRLTGNYTWTYADSKAKSSDNRNNEFRIGYFGKITGKSSLSVDLGLANQLPNSADASKIKKVVWSAGYIWQATPKTSLRVNYSASRSYSLSDAVATSGPFPYTKTKSLSVSDSLGLSIRLRLNRALSTELSFNGSHSRSKSHVSEGVPSATKSRQWSFPFQWALDYRLAEWIRLRFTYTFRYQLGDERDIDEHRAHTIFVSSNLSL